MCLKSWLQELWGFLFSSAWLGVRKKGERCAGLRDGAFRSAGQGPSADLRCTGTGSCGEASEKRAEAERRAVPGTHLEH